MTSRDGCLSDRCALVTGGARGIGAQTAIALARLGAHVIVNHITPGSASAVLDAIADVGGSAEAAPADVFDPAQLTGLLTQLTQRHRIDILVASAAAPHTPAPLLDLDPGDLAVKLTADITAAHTLTTTLAPAMRARGWGRLVYIGSRHADGPSAPGMTANGTSKAALAGYIRYVTEELTGAGVTANLIEPGYVATDRSALVSARIPGLITKLTPAGRTAGPADVAEAVALLVTAGEMINGITLPVTGGLNHPAALARITQIPALHTTTPP
jgi:3-oxoacyl-[acyl-carrier protein] reductase